MMSNWVDAARQPSLRIAVLAASGQDLRHCRSCWLCDDKVSRDQDISFGQMAQMILMNDDEVLTSKTLWSDEALQTAQGACSSGLNLSAIMLALRAEARRRNQLNTGTDQHEVSD
jgi:hypothetical protein